MATPTFFPRTDALRVLVVGACPLAASRAEDGGFGGDGRTTTELLLVDRSRPIFDPVVSGIVRSWPRRLEAPQATRLGFPVDESIYAVIDAHRRDGADERLAPSS